jgi:hypothetical protein
MFFFLLSCISTAVSHGPAENHELPYGLTDLKMSIRLDGAGI